MSNNETNALQANFKTPSGSLFNIYGKTPQEFYANMQAFAGYASELIEVEQVIMGKSSAPQIPTAVAQAFPGAQVVAVTPTAPAPQYAAPAPSEGSPACRHGAMTFVDGTKNGKTWKAWMCAAGKDAVDKCAPQWVK